LLVQATQFPLTQYGLLAGQSLLLVHPEGGGGVWLVQTPLVQVPVPIKSDSHCNTVSNVASGTTTTITTREGQVNPVGQSLVVLQGRLYWEW